MPSGSAQLRQVAADLKAAGSPARGLRRNLTKNLRAAAQPIKKSAQENARNIPAHGPGHTGLRVAVANATTVRVTTGRSVLVRVWTNPARMPQGQQALPAKIEYGNWRHPVFGEAGTWVSQDSHPYMAPAAAAHIGGVSAAVLKSVDEVAALLEH